VANDTFYWFDYETWGISPQWDRPAQFAGVRTDANLKPIGKPDMLYCQLPPDYLPDPGACLVTGLEPGEVNKLGIKEPEFIAEVVKRIGHQGTCSVGYNSIRFDDEVTRHTLFRNFRDPYRQEWHNGNSRWDLLDVVRLTRALRPDGIQWPVGDDGKLNNKLENLTAVNGLAHEQAHDALSDVYATIAVAGLIRDAQPRLYDFALSLRAKQTVAGLLNWQTRAPVLHVTGMVPMDRMHTSIVVPLMRHPTNANGIIALDMRTDPEALVGLGADDIRARLYNRDLPAENRIHLRTIQINRCPMIAPVSTLTESDAERIGLDRETELERASRVNSVLDESMGREIAAAMTHQATDASQRMDLAIARSPEASLYTGGFLSEGDRRLANKIAEHDATLLTGFEAEHGFFDDERLQRLFMNYRSRYALSGLTEQERRDWAADCDERLNETDDVPWRTLAGFDQLMKDANWPSGQSGLKASLERWRGEVLAYLAKIN